MRNNLILYTVGLLLFFSSNRPSEGSKKAGAHIKNTVAAAVESTPTLQTSKDDSANDPAIWINPSDPKNCVILETDKKGGLETYSLKGEQLNYFLFGEINNCDLRYGFILGDDKIDVLAASNRSNQTLSLYKISEGRVLDTIHSRTIQTQMSEEVYGLCMYKSKNTGKMYVFMNSKAGEIEQFELFASNHKIDARLVRNLKLHSQTEGMLADDENGVLYVGEEDAGIWKFDAEPSGSTEGTFISKSSEENQNIKYDIEGLAIDETVNGSGYLIASVQGNYSYAIFERLGANKFVVSFRILDGEIDGVEETDGLDVTSKMLPGFEKGFLVVQDGYNYEGGKLLSQNFKIVSWNLVEDIINNIQD